MLADSWRINSNFLFSPDINKRIRKGKKLNTYKPGICRRMDKLESVRIKYGRVKGVSANWPTRLSFQSQYCVRLPKPCGSLASIPSHDVPDGNNTFLFWSRKEGFRADMSSYIGSLLFFFLYTQPYISTYFLVCQ